MSEGLVAGSQKVAADSRGSADSDWAGQLDAIFNTRIPIVPGRRNVRALFRHRTLTVSPVPLIPWTMERAANTHLECQQAKPCGIVAFAYIDRKRNEPAVDIKELDAETIRADVLSVGLPSYVPPDQ